MPGPFIHNIDPIIGKFGGFYLWWYGLGYAIGLLHLHLFLRRQRRRLQLSDRDVYSLSLLIIVGVLLGGRAVEVVFDEWPFYSCNPSLIIAWWLGGMASHGVLLGAFGGVLLFARGRRQSFLTLVDALVVPGAFLLGMGRIGNFIDGQIVGAVTEVPWAVQFPDSEGFRHPVVLYDGAKNILLVPFLLWVRKRNPTPGAAAAHFVFWYPFLRIFIDLFRDYPTHRLALGTGQTLNLLMALVGAALLYQSRQRRIKAESGRGEQPKAQAVRLDELPLLPQRIALVGLLLFCLTLPSNWTQDVPARYGHRHPGLEHSWRYPEINTAIE